MRPLAWIFVVAAGVAALAVFLPVVEVGHVVSKRQTMSLHGAANHRALVRKLLGVYRRGQQMHIDAAAGKIAPHTGGRVKDYLDDANDAMDTLSGISDDDAKRAGQALVILTWIIIGLSVVAIALVFFDVVAGKFSTGRLIGAVVVAVFLVAIGIAVRMGMTLVAFEANDEIGANVVELGSAALVLPIATLVAFASSLVLLVLHVRAPRRT